MLKKMVQTPHGGRLISKILSPEEKRNVLRKSFKRIKVGLDFVLDLEKIAIGAYSPLTGFMKKKDFNSVVRKMRLANGIAWTIPVYLKLDEKTVSGFSKNEKVILCQEDGRPVGLMRIEEVFEADKLLWVRNVFGTENPQHPGVRKVISSDGKLIGGEVWLIQKPDFEFEKFNLTPLETRALIQKKGWKSVSGFQTRNVPHRAHEYLQKLALSITDGILIHPIIGWKKDGDFKPEAIISAYKLLIKEYFPENSVIFAGLATAMRYAGPREAVFHAIIRKNYGCTHFIVGRDHAGVGDFYKKYEAHRIFDHFPALGVTPLLLHGPYYCLKCKEVVSEKICPHDEKWHKHISGTFVRECVRKNKDIPDYVMRKEVFGLLRRNRDTVLI